MKFIDEIKELTLIKGRGRGNLKSSTMEKLKTNIREAANEGDSSLLIAYTDLLRDCAYILMAEEGFTVNLIANGTYIIIVWK